MKHWMQSQKKNVFSYFIHPRRNALVYAFTAFVGLLVIWWYVGILLEERLAYDEREQVATQVDTIGTSLTLAVNQRLTLIISIHSFMETEILSHDDFSFDNIDDLDEVNHFNSSLYNNTAGIRNIAIAPGGVMLYVYPYEENKAVLGYEPARDERPNVREEVRRAVETREIVLSLPYELIQGGQGLIARQAIYADKSYWGLANVVLDLPPLLEEAGISPIPTGLNLALGDQSDQVFYGAKDVFTSDPVIYSIVLPEGEWELAGIPNNGWGVGHQVPLWVYRMLGLSAVITIPLLAYQLINRRERLAFLVDQRTHELAQSNQALINVLEGIDADVYVADFDTHEILFANKHIKDSFNDDLVGKICYEVFRNESSVCAHCKNNLLLDTKKRPTEVLLWEDHNPITDRWYKNADRAIRWHDGRYVHMQIATDITEHKQAVGAIRESEERYRTLTEQIPAIVYVEDATVESGRMLYVNPQVEEQLGISIDDWMRDDQDTWINHVHPDERARVMEKYGACFHDREQYEDEYRMITSDGRTVWIHDKAKVIGGKDGQRRIIHGVMHDITERREAEEALRTKTEELETLFSISAQLRSAQSADSMLSLVLVEMRRVINLDASAIILLDADARHFTCAFGDGLFAENKGQVLEVDKSISGLVFQSRKPYVIENLSADSNKANVLNGTESMGPAVCVPVQSDDEFLGTLICARKQGQTVQPYLASEVQLLVAIGEMVGNALRRARLYDQALARLQNVQALHSIDMAISANLDLSVILDVLLTQGTAQLDVDAASILLLNPHTHMLEYAAGKGFRTKEIESPHLRFGEGLPGQAVINHEVTQIHDLTKSDNLIRRKLLEEGFVSYQAAPLVAKGQLQGVLEIFNRRLLPISEEKIGFLETLAMQAAIAIDNSRLFTDLQRSNFELGMAYDATIEGWSRALELRDQETEGHTLRVTDLTMRLTQAMGVKGVEYIHIRRGALLHDIGKMGVPDRILLKPGKLTSQEWKIMKQHTEYAFEMLWPIEFLRPAIDIPLYHHERWDGAGYPRSLKEEQIPLSARIFAVVDVWDALNNDRPYRKAWTEDKALEYITTNSGKHFDPRVVETFLDLRDKNGKI